MIRIAQNIERYNLAYTLAWKHISERQKREYPNVATLLHDAIRRQLKEGAVEPDLIASEALTYIEKLTGQFHSDEEPAVPADEPLKGWFAVLSRHTIARRPKIRRS